MTDNQKALCNLGFFFLLLIAFFIFKSWTDARFKNHVPTRAESAEAWRLQKLEDGRVQNYIEHIKPHVPAGE